MLILSALCNLGILRWLIYVEEQQNEYLQFNPLSETT
jgi:hypothetical protein